MTTIVQEAKNRQTKTIVQVLDHRDRDDLTPEEKWETVCCDHGTTCSHHSKSAAVSFAASPADWCGLCDAQLNGVTEMFKIGETYTAYGNLNGITYNFTCDYVDGDKAGFVCGHDYYEVKIQLSSNGIQHARVLTVDGGGCLVHNLWSQTPVN